MTEEVKARLIEMADSTPVADLPRLSADLEEIRLRILQRMLGPPQKPEPERLLLTTREAAVILGMARSTVYQLVSTGEIKATLIGNAQRIHRDELERFAKRASGTAVTLPPRVKK